MTNPVSTNNFTIPVTETYLAGMSFFQLFVRGYDTGLSITIHNKERVLNVGTWNFSEKTNFGQVLTNVKMKFNQLFDKADSIDYVWTGRHFTLIDAHVTPENPAEVLKTVVGPNDPDYTVLVEPVFAGYAVLDNIPSDVPRLWSEKVYTQLATRFKSKSTVVLHIDGAFATIHVFNGKKWALSVPYTVRKLDDVAYFILYALEELALEPLKTQVFYAGTDFKSGTLQHSLERFVDELRPLDLHTWTVKDGVDQHKIALESHYYHAHR